MHGIETIKKLNETATRTYSESPRSSKIVVIDSNVEFPGHTRTNERIKELRREYRHDLSALPSTI